MAHTANVYRDLPAHFFSAQMALVSTFFQMFIVHGIYNFEEVVNIKRERSKKITQPHNGAKTSKEIYRGLYSFYPLFEVQKRFFKGFFLKIPCRLPFKFQSLVKCRFRKILQNW